MTILKTKKGYAIKREKQPVGSIIEGYIIAPIVTIGALSMGFGILLYLFFKLCKVDPQPYDTVCIALSVVLATSCVLVYLYRDVVLPNKRIQPLLEELYNNPDGIYHDNLLAVYAIILDRSFSTESLNEVLAHMQRNKTFYSKYLVSKSIFLREFEERA